MSKHFFIGLSVALGIGIVFLLMNTGGNQNASTTDITQTGDTQYIKIVARGGYNPKEVTAQANKKTILEIETKGTYDCSSALVIPKLSYQKNLPATGITTIEIPAIMTQDSIEILCAMGMYKATIHFGT